jgi:hypothetical protein
LAVVSGGVFDGEIPSRKMPCLNQECGARLGGEFRSGSIEGIDVLVIGDGGGLRIPTLEC